ncbi:unnamed protein product [Urochloa humidicola]
MLACCTAQNVWPANVCSPWTKKQKVLFPITTTPAQGRKKQKLETQEILGAFFIDPDPDEDLNMSNFRILPVQLRQCHHDSSKIVEAFIFSASRDDHRWHQLGSMAIGDDIIPYMMWPRLTKFVGRIVLCDKQCDVEYILMFSVHMQNIILQRVQKLNRHGDRAFPYELPWTICACL